MNYPEIKESGITAFRKPSNVYEFYKVSDDFRKYVDKTAMQRKVTVEQALTLKIVSEYMEYLIRRDEGIGFNPYQE